MPRKSRLKVGGTKFREFLQSAMEENAMANEALGELLDARRADELTDELFLELVAVIAAAVGSTHVVLARMERVVQAQVN